MAPVRLQFGLPGSPGSDASPQTGQIASPSRQAGKKIFKLRQLHLIPPFPRFGPLGENVQNQLGAVDHLARHDPLQVIQLGRGQLLIEDDQIGSRVLRLPGDLFRFSPADQPGGIHFIAKLQFRRYHLSPCGIRKTGQLLQRGTQIPSGPLRAASDQYRSFTFADRVDRSSSSL